MQLDGCYLAGLAVHLPATLPITRAAELGLCDPPVGTDEGWTAVAVAGEVAAPDLAIAAARQALAASGHRAGDIKLLLHCSIFHQGPDGWAAPQYIQQAVLGGNAPAMDLRQGCNGLLGAIELASAYLAAAPGREAALLTAADNFGAPTVDRFAYGWNQVRQSILGDAGCALVLSRRGGFARVRAVDNMSLPELEPLYRGTDPLFPPACTVGVKAELTSRIAHLPAGALKEAAAHLGRARTEFVQRFLADAGVRPADITRVTHVFAGHRGYLERLLEPIGIDPDRGVLAFGRTVGHLAATDYLAGLDHLVRSGEVGPGDLVLMMGNGAGVSVACALVEILDRPVDRSAMTGEGEDVDGARYVAVHAA